MAAIFSSARTNGRKKTGSRNEDILVCQRSPLSRLDEGTPFTGELDTPYLSR